MFQKHAGRHCQGLQLHITNRNAFRSISAALALIQEVCLAHPEDFGWREEVYEFVGDRLAIDLLIGDPIIRQAVENQVPINEIVSSMALSRATFEARRKEHLIYRE